MADLVSYSGYARLKGWSQPYVSKLVKQGKIPITDGGKIDPTAADAALAQTREAGRDAVVRANAARKRSAADAAAVAPVSQAGTPEPPAATYRENPVSAATALDRMASAQLKTLKLNQESGRLVDKARFIHGMMEGLSPALQRLRSVPSQIAPTIAAETDVRRCMDIMEDEIDSVCDQISEMLRTMAQGLTH